MNVDTQAIKGDLIKVTVTEDGFTEVGYVKGYDGIDRKRDELREMIQQKAISALEAAAIGVPSTPSHTQG